MLRILAFAIVMATALPSAAEADARQEKITELVRVMGLRDAFDRQIEQSRAAYAEIGKKMVAQVLAEAGVTDPEKKARLEVIFQRYLERGASRSQWKAEDLVEIWSRHYGQDLSDDDLDQILAFYKSPVGQRELAASQAATTGYTAEVQARSQVDMQDALKQLAAELRQEMAK